MRSIEAEVAARGAILSGALTLPGGGAEAVVLCIHGTGPMDRDQNFVGQKLDVFNTIAAHLAARGIATFRYDKRGCGESTGDYLSAGHFDLVADAVACLHFLKAGSLARFQRFHLLGHSEGTIIAAEVAAERGGVDGLVLLSPFLQRLEDILMAQAGRMEAVLPAIPGFGGFIARLMTKVTGSPTSAQRSLIRKLRATSKPVIRHRLSRVTAKSLRELLTLDPPAIYARVKVPTLLVAGGKDLQCDPEDASRIAAIIGPTATAIVIPDLTHCLRKDSGEHTFLSYAQLIKLPLDTEVLDIVGAWLARAAPP